MDGVTNVSNPEMGTQNSEYSGGHDKVKNSTDSNDSRRHSMQNVSTNKNFHVRFNPKIVAYPSQNGPIVNCMESHEESQKKDKDIQIGIIEYMQRVQDDNECKSANKSFDDLSKSHTSLYQPQKVKTNNKRVNSVGSIKNWAIVRQRFEEDRDFFFSKQPRVNIILYF